MNKVHIATLWNALNYGAYLQAYALGCFCRKNGSDVAYYIECKESRTIFSCVSRNVNKMIYQLKLQNVFSKYLKNFPVTSVKNYSSLMIIGADEVWNVNNQYFQHLGLYIGDEVNSSKIITYAACANGASAEVFCRVYGTNPFSKINKISVRDKSTKDMVENILSKQEVEIVLDPTFLLDNYDDIKVSSKYNDYLFVYGYSFNECEIHCIKKFAFSKGLKIISAGAYLEWTDVQLPVGPGEFLGLIEGAKYVITSTFHGTIFSIIFNKEFMSFARSNNKIIEILDDFQLSDRNGSINELQMVFDNKINYLKVNELKDKKRETSIAYLMEAMNKND
jgi:hypothetical protein